MSNKKPKEKSCIVCGEVFPIEHYERYGRTNMIAKKCDECSDNRIDHQVFKDGYLNTDTPKGYNWLLGR